MRRSIAALAITALALAALPAAAAAPKKATKADDASEKAIALEAPVAIPLGEVLEDCLDDALTLHFMLHPQQFGEPERVRDTVVRYDKKLGVISVRMLGSATTTDDAKSRLESRQKALSQSVHQCAESLDLTAKDVFRNIEFIYARVDREKGEQQPLLRWYRGRWELL